MYIYDLDEGKANVALARHIQPITSFDWCYKNTKLLGTCSFDTTILIWSKDQDQPVSPAA